MAASPHDPTARPHAHQIQSDGMSNQGWRVKTVKGPILSDRESDDIREMLGGGVLTLPEMLFNHNLVELTHVATGTVLSFNALDALKGWKQENLPPLQVKVAKEWRKAREHEIQAQKAIQLEYDWTFTTPYGGSVSRDATASASASAPQWAETTDQIDRSLLMERDPILFYDEVMLYESDLDDNGVCQLSVKLRVMPKCWLVLLRLWLRVDGCLVRLREARLFCRHDQPDQPVQVLRETKYCEGHFDELRKKGAPAEGPAYADADAASQVFTAVAPVGLATMRLEKLVVS